MQWRKFGLLSLLLLSPAVRADEDPVLPPPDVQTLTLSKDGPGGNVVLNWTDGVSPFSVQRSQSPDFSAPTNLTYVTTSTPSGPASDPVLADGQTYYYLVSDANAATQVYTITSPAGAGLFEGEQAVINGTGFDSNCANNVVFFDDATEVTPTACSPTQVTVTVPPHVVSGSVTVLTPNKVTPRQRMLFAVGLRTNTPRQNQTHINVDTDHNLYIADQRSPQQVVWRLSYGSGLSFQCSTIANPVGMPRLGSKLFLVTDSEVANNAGNVRELDVSCTPLVSWGNTGTINTDPVYGRAVAVNPQDTSYVYVLDHAADRIRRRQNQANLDTMWLTSLNLGGTVPPASDPAGFTFNNAGHFFFTSATNLIRHYDNTRSPVQNFTAADGVARASQLVFDEAQTLWVANRDVNNVLRIRTDPANRLVRTKVSNITAPRGIALDQDPVTADPWVYVADQTDVYRFEVYDTVHLDVKVLNEALVDPNTGVRTSTATFEKRVRDHVQFASDVYKKCGIEVVVDRVLFIGDPNANNGIVLTNQASPLHQNESNLLATARSSNPLAVNVYYINHYLHATTMTTLKVNGVSYTNDFVPAIANPGLAVAVFSTTVVGNPLNTGSVESTLSHELGHFLLDNFNNGGPGNLEHKGNACGADSDRIMHGTGCRTRKRLIPAECANIRTGADGSAHVEEF